MSSIVIVIPYRKGSKELAEKVAKIHKSRAGMPCKIYIIEDVDAVGWVSLINKAFRELEFDYFVYSCDDYFPGRDYLKLAYDMMVKEKVGLVAFNDGKWHGRIATAALVSKEFAQSIYGDAIFYTGYKQSYGDTELTEWAMNKKQFAYCPEAVLMEIDYLKESKPHVNEEDKKRYGERKLPFPKRFS